MLFNASPDVRTQLEHFPDAHPKNQVRGSGIKAIILIDAQIDHSTGLLILREGEPLNVYCTEMVKEDLSTGFPIFKMLDHFCGINHTNIPFDGSSFTIPEIDDLRFTAISLTSKAPPYSPHRNDPHDGDNIGVTIEQISTGKRLFYAPGLGAHEAQVITAMHKADCVMVDGTFWTDDELASVGRPEATSFKIGHLPQSDEGGMIELLNKFSKPRKILIHINNTNPILDKDSPQRKILDENNIEVSYDGMEITI